MRQLPLQSGLLQPPCPPGHRPQHRRLEPGGLEGRTTSIALHILAEGYVVDKHTHPVWSFVKNRFIPRTGHLYSSFFSEEPWEQRTVEKAIANMLRSP